MVVTLRRKNFDHVYHEILCFLVILTLGMGFIIYLILRYSKKPNTCPNCESVFDLDNLPSNPLNSTKDFGLTSKFIFP